VVHPPHLILVHKNLLISLLREELKEGLLNISVIIAKGEAIS